MNIEQRILNVKPKRALEGYVLLRLFLGATGVLGLAISTAGLRMESRAEQNEGWKPLFNGRNLDGWYTFLQKYGRNSDPEKVITIEDGVIHAYKFAPHAAPVVMGYMGTNEEYADYHLRLQYKWGRKQFQPRYHNKPDSGVYYHFLGPDLVWPQAMQFQVQWTDAGDILTVGNIKVDTTIDPATKGSDLPRYLPSEKGGIAMTTKGQGVTYTRKEENYEIDGWNTIELICKGDAAVHLVNRHIVNRCRNIRQADPKDPQKWMPLTRGRILIEFEATEIFFRKIELRQLQPNESIEQAAHVP